MTEQILKDRHGKIIGRIKDDISRRNLEILNVYGKRLGTYNPRTNETRDFRGKIIGKGNLLTMLL
ncbi:MAG: hypothetical protein A3H98_07975 [Bacteroidetes bacterium RIFCSPLOWO2_02_FULL_36_8]|nr:MAG: hypothetical protein A3H98_07975 [Bacteroidetes bacterium RIFCSPLOWO2_02_FULL_36_8]OFY68969.1 MAG: hypothetical protein A3G23_10435 [Bacteroidetes bacterium RIFCSPLOWO2_12_FULL_37_12]